ncbi:MAG: hypothetical protein KA004_11220 [Verrucomicrobiales bacterium]|nr:hypothetical protein [Verrucomicrobiales bacterium]
MIVIVATEDDLAMPSVVQALERLGRRDVLLLDLEKAHEKMILTSRVENGCVDWSIQSRVQPDLVVTPENVTAVYWRRPISYIGSPVLGLPTTANLDQIEIFWSIRWHLEALSPALFPLGHPWVFARAENKHRQMEAARKVGFTVPQTIHSNDLAALRDFIARQQEVAVKALRMPAVSADGDVKRARHIACKLFTAEFLDARLAAVERGQLFCQKAVRRTHDLRITVLPRQTICAAIDTTTLEGNKLDWREDSLHLAHKILPVDPVFDRQLRAFLEEMELTAGYFDFAVPNEGPPIFFECNTNAQWHWIEAVTGHPFSEAIARELAECGQGISEARSRR